MRLASRPDGGRTSPVTRRRGARRAVGLIAAYALVVAGLATVTAPSASADGVGPHPKTLQDCQFSPESLLVTSDGTPAPYTIAFTPQDSGYADGDSIYVWEQLSIDGVVQFGGGNPIGFFSSGAWVYDETRVGQVYTWKIGAIDAAFDDGGGLGAPDWNSGGLSGDWLCTHTFTYGAATEGGVSDPIATAVPTVALACSPSSAPVGATVTCRVTGRDAGVGMLWRASYNPVFAEAGVTLGGDGTGTFSFVLPAAARGQEVMVELVEWTAPVSIGVVGVGSLVPTSVPAGEGPSVPAAWLAILPGLSLVAARTLRRRETGRVG